MEFIKKVLKSKIKSLKQDIKNHTEQEQNDKEHAIVHTCWKNAKESELEYMVFLLDIIEREEKYIEAERDKELLAEDERVACEIYDMAEESGAHELAKWIDTHYLNGLKK